ncbi:unnamed protein product [Strongylus vulgaris]|uniref:Uncharacterized protein n=1 Tax=Strongylus vulgaris TaxID=40348 RepID=A0A3P7M414_STRVU|nr:unnamed protein product [Strongylus vulgaris]
MFEKFDSADFGGFECSDLVEVTDEEADPEKKENKRAIELADYLTLSDKGVQTNYTQNQHHSEAETFSIISKESTSKKKLSPTPMDLLDISAATKAPHIFLVCERIIKQSEEPFDLKQQA